MSDVHTEITAEAKRIEEDALYSARSHFTAAQIWKCVNLIIGIPSALAAGAAGVVALQDHPTAASVIAFSVACTTALMTFLDPSGKANQHLVAGNAYNALKNTARIFGNIDVRMLDGDGAAKERLVELAKHRDDLNASSPQPMSMAFWMARRGIEHGEAAYAVDSGKKVGQ